MIFRWHLAKSGLTFYSGKAEICMNWDGVTKSDWFPGHSAFWLCQYYYMVAPLNSNKMLGKNWIGITQRFYGIFWTKTWSINLKSSSYMATYLPSHKLFTNLVSYMAVTKKCLIHRAFHIFKRLRCQALNSALQSIYCMGERCPGNRWSA